MSRFTIRRRKGFTLIEIMIVVLIIAVLLAIAIPNFMRARESSRARSCQANLRQIETAKEQYAMDAKLGDLAAVAAGSLDPYIKGGETSLACPSSGTYTFNAIGVNASCSVGGTAGTFNYHGL